MSEHRPGAGTVTLRAGEAEATIALRGAEPLSWRVGGRELLWHGDPAHWEFRAPLLFPVVGASAGGAIRVGGIAHPMPQHGFARRARFDLVDADGATARLRLTESAGTLGHYPFRFVLDVAATLAPRSLRIDVSVTHPGVADMPYAVGFHPAFPWPFAGGASRDGHAVVFAEPESDAVPEVAEGGLLARRTRRVPMRGGTLPLSPDLFTEALVFLDAKSRSFAFAAPDGSAIALSAENLPHLAVWSRPTAPFLSLEAWSGHADWEDAGGELRERASMSVLPPGGTGRHAIEMSWRERGSGP